MRALIARAVVAGFATVLLLAGCSSTPPSEVIGQPLAGLATDLSTSTTLLVQDASPRIGRDAQYDSGLDKEDWTIVAACSDAESIESSSVIEVAVVPADLFDVEVEAAIEAGDFDDAVACRFDD